MIFVTLIVKISTAKIEALKNFADLLITTLSEDISRAL